MSDDYLLLYETVENMAERRAPHREAHLAHLRAARGAGKLGIGGAIGDPVFGAAFHFTVDARADVEEFVRDDPYRIAGLIASYRIETWNLV